MTPTKRRDKLLSLVVPWAAVALIAIVAAAYFGIDGDGGNNNNNNISFDDSHSKMSDKAFMRQLYGDDGYVPPSDDYPYPAQQQQQQPYSPRASSEHHHKPVYNEEHPPLFPLSTRDYVGFVLAVLGLMVAVSVMGFVATKFVVPIIGARNDHVLKLTKMDDNSSRQLCNIHFNDNTGRWRHWRRRYFGADLHSRHGIFTQACHSAFEHYRLWRRRGQHIVECSQTPSLDGSTSC